jgi:hypothetical protein
MSEERSIQDYLDDIMNAVYGEEVRSSIVGAITQCYEDGRTGAVDAIARGRLDVIEPIVESTQETTNANVLATLQAEKVLSQDGINDLNRCTETGKYYAPTSTVASVIANQPADKTSEATFAVIVIQHVATTNIIQILIDAQWKMWIRRGYLSGGAWTYGGWQRFLRSSDLSDINTALDTKANKNNSQLTGAPVATTANDNDNSTRIATTAYVMREANKRATKANPTLSNPTLTGTAVAPTPAASSNNTTIATTQYVTRAINNFKGAFDTAMSSTSVNAVQNKVINTALAAKANLASPALTGNPTAPTQTAGNSSTRIATTAFVTTAVGNAESELGAQISALNASVQSLDASKAPKASPTFTGTVTAPTVSGSSDSSTKVATTAFVQSVKNAALASKTYANNATLTLKKYASFSGYVGSSKRFVGFLVPVPKSLENVTGVEVTAITGAVFGVNGAVSGSTYSTNWITHKQDGAVIMTGATADIVSNNLLQINMNFGTALDNSTNLTPITFVATNLAFKFTVN